MRKFSIVAVSFPILLGALYAHFFYSTETDELATALRYYSFLPIKPASKSHKVGTIYFIEPDLATFTPICVPANSDKYVHKSPSAVVSGARSLQGTYVSKIKVNTGQMIGGKSSVDDKRSIKVHYELTNVTVYGIAADSSKALYDQLMNTKDCSDMVTKYLDLSGYICQDLQLLEASASFKLHSESDTGASLDLNTEKALASEVESAMHVRLTGEEGRSTAGEGLQWGIQMARLCITPAWARYPRTFPRNNFERMLNFIKFNILEPILPAA